jgi:hypothetical protein
MDSSEKSRPVKLQGKTNYQKWSMQMESMLQSRDLWSIIDLTYEDASSVEAEAEQAKVKTDQAAFRTDTPDLSKDSSGPSAGVPPKKKNAAEIAAATRDAKVRYAILINCCDEPASRLRLVKTARGAWERLQELYSSTGRPKLSEKLGAFHAFKPKTSTATILDISTELDALQAEITLIDEGQRPTDEAKTQVLLAVVRARGTRFDNIIMQFEDEESPDYTATVKKLIRFEEREDVKKVVSETALQAAAEEPPSIRGRGSGRGRSRGRGRGRGRGGRQPGGQASNDCFHCGKPGHYKSECRTRLKELADKGGQPSTGPLAQPGGGKGFSPPRNAEANYTDDYEDVRCTEVIEGDDETSNWVGTPVGSDMAWVIDSGSSRHMTYAREAFITYAPLETRTRVRIANGAIIEAVGTGSVSFYVTVGIVRRMIRLHDVLHVPGLSGSLISTAQLEDKGVMTRPLMGGRILIMRDRKVLGVANRIGSTYILETTMANDVDARQATTKIPRADAKVWHRRFGHLGTQSLKNIQFVTEGMPEAFKALTAPCEHCLLNKSTRVINRKAPEHVKEVLIRVHSDMWGKYRVPSLKGEVYFITFTDDYSRKSWVYLIHTKDQLRAVFQEFKVRVEAETGKKVKIVRCDNGSEYCSLESTFGPIHGVAFEFTTAYTPWQNGVSERLNRALTEIARAMLSDSGLPLELWGEALMAACHIRNRTPIGPRGMTPEEAYSGKKPSVAHLRAWGCVAYANIAPEQRNKDKLVPNGRRSVLVGYMAASRQYRLYDPVKKEVFISSYPIFLEDSRYNLPDGVLPRAETVGFDPMEADPESDEDSMGPVTYTPPATPTPRRAVITGVISGGQRDQPAAADRGESRESATPSLPLSLPAEHSSNGNRQRNVDPPREPSQDREKLPSYPPSPDVEDEDDEAEHQLLEAERAAQGASSPEDPPLRRSERERRPARRFEEAFAAALEEIKRPGSYNEALEDPVHGAEWRQAVTEELAKLQALGTWDLSPLPLGKMAVGCRWVFNVKLTSTGLLDRYKARLVAQGFTQVAGDTYLETFSPTIRGESLRTLMAIAAYEDLEIRQIDVVSAYPNSELHAEIYMKPPPGLPCPEGTFLRIRKSLYGLKQSGREWYIEACKGLKELGLEPLFSEPSIFATRDRGLIVGLYVDDMVILGKDMKTIDAAVSQIKRRWAIKDLGDAGHILGLRIHRDRKRRLLSLDQLPYIEQMLKRFGLEKAKPFPSPASDRNALIKSDGSEEEADQNLYQQGIGSINWLSVCSRPDVSYCCGMLAQHCNAPTVRNWNGVMHLMRYISGTKEHRIWFGGYGNTSGMGVNRLLQEKGGGVSPDLMGFCDADHAGDVTDRKSVSGHIFLLNRGPISWSSTKQRCVATSTAEAEYIALAEASKQSQWLRSLLIELDRASMIGPSHVARIFSDNQACIAIAGDPMAHRRTKHIDVRYHYIRQLIGARKARVSYLPTEDMLADVLTKPLPLPLLRRCIGLYLMPAANEVTIPTVPLTNNHERGQLPVRSASESSPLQAGPFAVRRTPAAGAQTLEKSRRRE